MRIVEIYNHFQFGYMQNETQSRSLGGNETPSLLYKNITIPLLNHDNIHIDYYHNRRILNCEC